MQVQQQGVLENTELIGRLKIGGRWYGPGSVVALDKGDIEVLEMRGISKRPVHVNAEPENVEKSPVRMSEVIPAINMPIQTKIENEEGTGNGYSQQNPRKRR